MKAVFLSFALLLCCAAGMPQSWQPIVNLHISGYCDSWNRCVYRTNSGTLYMIVNASPISGGASSLRILKATVQNPTSFIEMDSANRPTDGSRFVGADGRLNTNTGIISIAYEPSTPTARYITFDTNTDTWGTSELIANLNAQDDLRYLSHLALALDASGIPHVIYGGANDGLIYRNRSGGTWGATTTLSSNSSDKHPTLVMGTDGVLHLAWYRSSGSRAIFYAERSASGAWGATETIDSSVGTFGDQVDQSPSIALDKNNLPLILYHEQADINASVIIKQRTAASTFADVSPVAGSPPSTGGHDWSIATLWNGDWVICGHEMQNPVQPTCKTRSDATGTWGPLVFIVNDGTARDGSTTIRYDPIFPGTTNTVDVEESDENSPSSDWFYNATITGSTGGGIPTATLSTNSLTFADQIVGTTSAGQNVIVTNTGGGSLTISSISVPPGFSESDNCSAALSQNTSCQITVNFAPTSTGLFSGALTITDSADTSPRIVTLSGSGVSQQLLLISGTISPTSAGTGVTVALTGAASAATMTDTSGNFTFNGLANGTYTVTPSLAGATFSPVSRAVTLSGSNVTGISFTAIPNGTGQIPTGESLFTTQAPATLGVSDGSSANYELGVALSSVVPGSILAIRFWKDAKETGTHTGHLWAANGQLLATATFSGETASGWQQASFSATVQIAPNTQYVASVNTGRTFFVVTNGGLTAKITNQDLSTVVGNNGLYGTAGQFPANSFQHSNYFRDVVFSPNSNLLSASGSVLPATLGAGTTLTLAGSGVVTTVADANGNYTFNSLPNGSYSITPSKTGFTFTPPSLPLTLTGSNATGLNFTAVAITGSITGTISPTNGGSGATVSLSGVTIATVTADINGFYSFNSLPLGKYTVTPSQTGFTFAPTSQTVTIAGASPVTLDFVASPVPTAPILSVSPLTRNFAATQGGADPPAASINISNVGAGTLSYSVTSDQPWLTASPLVGSAPQTLTVRASAVGLAANTYTAHLLISAGGAQGSPAIVTVTFVILPPVVVPAVLSVTPSGLTFTSTQGGSNPASQTLNVTNTGGGTLAFTVASDQSWLTASPASGSAPQPITVSVANAGLTSGTYTGHVSLTAPGVQGSPVSIAATFTVAPQPTGSLLLGSQSVLGNRDSNGLGQAEAFQSTAVSTGTLTTLSLYVDSTNTARRITLGLYTDNSGHPGTLLTQATTTAATSGTWNTLAVPAVSITSGVKYWIAILASSSGSFRFRDNSSASCGNEGSSQTNLTSLPAAWTTGPIWGNCPVSVYGK